MAVFYDNVGPGDFFIQDPIAVSPVSVGWDHYASGSQIGVLVGLSYWVYSAALTDLTRTVTCGGKAMTSLGAKQWGTTSGWTEVFGLTGVPEGKNHISAVVSGGLPLVGRAGRGASLSMSGVGGFGTAVTASGTAAGPLSVAATAAAIGRTVSVFGSAQVGLKNFNQTQRYLSNTGVALLMGDADGSGSSTTFSTDRTASGPWGAVAVPVIAADLIATLSPLVAEPIVSSAGKRFARPGTNRRTVFTIEPEA